MLAFARWCTVPTRKFKVGRTVFIKAAPHQNLPGGAYVIVQKMPERDGKFEYRVRNTREQHERVLREGHLSATPQPRSSPATDD